MKSIRSKFFLCFLLCIVIPWLAMTTLITFLYSSDLRDRYIGDTVSQLKDSLKSFCSKTENAEQLLYNIFISDTFNQMLCQNEFTVYDSLYRSNTIHIDNYLSTSLGTNDFIDGAAVFFGDRLVTSVKYPYWGDSIQNSAFFQQLNASTGSVVYQNSLPILDSYLNPRSIFLIGKPIKKIEPGKNEIMVSSTRVGSVVLIIDNDKILNMMQSELGSKRMDICLSAGGDVICSTIPPKELAAVRNEVSHRVQPPQYEWASGSFTYPIGGKNQIILYTASPQNQFCAYGVVDAGEVYGGFAQLEQSTLFAYLFCLFAFIIFTRLINTLINDPIQRLRSSMKRVTEGDFTVSVAPAAQDEIGMMCASFNYMVDQLREMIQQIHEDYEVKAGMEISMLQYQINPHFIYNVLSSIRFKALMNQDQEVAVMLQRVSRLFSRTLGKSGKNISLAMEIENIRDFVFIYCSIFSNPINVSISVEPGIEGLYVPNMLLQPIVENCFVHGSIQGTENFCIIIRAIRRDGDILFYISDDGVGMDAQTIEGLLSEEGEAVDAGYNKIGIHSINKRLKLLFGSEYGIQIDSRPGCFTKVTIKIPDDIQPENGEGSDQYA